MDRHSRKFPYLGRYLVRLLTVIQICSLGLLFPLSSALAAPAAAPGVLAVAGHGTAAPMRVDVAQVASAAPSTRAHRTKPFRTARPEWYRVAKAAANRKSSGVVTAAPLPEAGSVVAGAGFRTVTLNQQIGKFGSDQALEPPDTYLAVGTTYVVQANNSVMSFWTKTGGFAGGVDLNTFVGDPAGYFASDPRVEYDTTSGRFFLSLMAFDNNLDSIVYVAVSQTSDPTGLWWMYSVMNATGVLHDQPKLGIADDKVVVAYDNFTTTAWFGTQILIFQKSQMLTGSSVSFNFTSPNTNMFSVAPSQALSSTTTAYLAFNNADPFLVQTQPVPTIGVITVTGTPVAGNVTLTEYDLAMAATQVPPSATQPGGTVNTNDDRFTGAVWQNGTLWTGGNTGCTPSGDSLLRSCMRLVQVNTTGATPTVVQAVDYGYKGYHLYYPAEGLDSANNLIVGFSASSVSLYPGVAAFGAPNGTTVSPAADTPVLLAKGLDTYTGSRWGDYSGAATDPSDPTKVWIADEYSAAPSGNWGTGVAKLSLAPAF